MNRPCLAPLLLALLLTLSCCDAATDVDPDADASPGQDASVDASPDGLEDTGPDTMVRPELSWPPGEPGPFRTGYRRIDVTYQPPGLAQPRVVPLGIWYPTEDTSGEEATYLGIFADEGSFADASLAPPVSGERYPLHLHSHGSLGYAGASPALFQHFASHGWVVAAPDHVGNTTLDATKPRPTELFWLRGTDLSASLDVLAALEAPDSLAGRLDTSRVILSGHSFGGYTALGVGGATFDLPTLTADCASDQGPGGACTNADLDAFAAGVADPRVIAIIPMAAGNRAVYGDEGLATVSTPTLMLSGTDDQDVKNALEGDPTWSVLSGGDALRVDITGGCHQTFAIGGCSQITDAEGFRIVNTWSMAFARFHLLGDTGVTAILDGSQPVSDSLVLSHGAGNTP